VIITPKAVTLHLTNPEAASKAARHEVAHMLRKTDVWETVFHLPIQAVVRTPPPDIAGLAELPLDLRGPTHQVARRALASALLRWQASLAPALAGDEAAQEDILTAAASLRAVLKLFAGCFDQRAAQKLQKPLKEIERTVKQARRARAGLAAAEGELAELGKETGTTSLLAAWKKQRAAAKAQVQACLGGAGASDLLAALAALLAAEPAGEAAPVHRRLGQIVDALAAEMGRRERALTPEKPKTYTRLGNSVERCRCALGFFAPALPVGPVQALIADLACLEAHLEKLEDDRWSQKRLTRFLDDWASQQAKRKAPQLHGVHNVLDYARARRDAQEASLQKLKPALASVRPARLRQGVRAALQAARTEPRSS
jgi:inorganic triphosphatase YgiF